FLGHYVDSKSTETWRRLSIYTAQALRKGEALARALRKWTRAFIMDRHALPYEAKNTWTKSLLERHPELKADVLAHLQSLGKYVCAMDIVHFMSDLVLLDQYGLASPISLSTAQHWMHTLKYRWTKDPSGQFIDGHERVDVVNYRQSHFLP
ncbi:hypothetical protein C8Q74DRAFT_1178564, partial [Fomes fomentarius]